MKFHIHNLKFRYQIILVFLVVFLLSSVGSGIAFYNISANQVTDNFSSTSRDAIGQIENTLETRLDIINERAESMLINHSFSSVLGQYLNQPTHANTVLAQGNISDYLKDFELGERLIDSSYLYTSRIAFDNYVHFRRMDFNFLESPFYEVYQDEGVNSVQWMEPMENLIFQERATVIPCVRRFTVPGFRGWQYFVYQIDQNRLRELIMGQEPFFDDIIILDGKGRVILGNSLISPENLLELWNQDFREGRVEEEHLFSEDDSTRYLVEGAFIDTNGWKVFGLKSEQEMLGSLKTLRRDILKILTVLLVVSLALIVLIAKHMTDALNRLETQMNYAKNGDFNVRFFYPYKDEIGSLSQCFNYMIEEIQTLIKKQNQSIIDLRIERDHVAEVQKQKRKTELKALQAQINPHFLYNTLNTITWQVADKEDMEDVVLLASSLGKFFRLSLSKGAEIIRLSDEIDHVRCYLDIQEIRYEDKLQYQMEVDEELLEHPVLKLILQPLVENAIYHGIKEKKRKGQIRITAEKGMVNHEPVILLSVWDNGAGIPHEKLVLINKGLSKGANCTDEGYGIYNVNERIKLYYGDEFGLNYESREGEFTKAILTIPCDQKEVE